MTFSRRTIPALTAMFAASFALTGVAAANPSNLTLHTAADSDQTNDRTPDLTFDGANAAEVVTLRVARSSHPDDGWTNTDSATAGNDGTGELTDNLAITDPNDIVTLAADGDSGAMSQVQTMVNVVPVLSASFSDGGSTADTRPRFQVSSAIRSENVALYVDGVRDTAATMAADINGNINGLVEDPDSAITPSSALAPGTHTVTVRTVDAADNLSDASDPIQFYVRAPAPAFADLIDGAKLNQSQPTLVVNVDPTATNVTVSHPNDNNDGYVEIAHTDAVPPSGRATVTPELAEGTDRLVVTQVVNGVTSVTSEEMTVTVKTSAPVLDPFDDPISSENRPWFSASNLLINNADNDTKLKLYVDGQLAATDDNFGGGTDSVQPEAALTDGNHSAYVTTVDDLGHEGPASNAISFAIDATAPALPTAVSPANGATVTSGSPQITLHSDPGAIVHLLVDEMQDEGDLVADANGNVTFTLSANLADGTHTLYFWSRDVLWNATDVTSSTFTVKTTVAVAAPAATPVVVPVTPVAPVAPVAPTVTVVAPAKVSLSSHTLTASKPVKVGFTLAKAGTIKVTITKVVKGKTVVVATVSVKAKAGKGSYTLKTKVGNKKLTKGSYKVSLQTVSGKKTSKPTAAQKIKVR